MDTTQQHELRSRLMNYAIITELEIEEFIAKYFIGNDKRKELFGELILKKEFFTFEQKIRVFTKIINENNIEIEEFGEKIDKKDLIKNINWIREVRNAIAHNHPFRNPKTNEITIKYKYDNKTKEIPLTSSFDKEFFKIYMQVFKNIRWGIKIKNI
jgi:hypothetical protein